MDITQWNTEEAMVVWKEEGMEEQAADTTMKMLKKGFDTAVIAELTNMPIKWVERILKFNPYAYKVSEARKTMPQKESANATAVSETVVNAVAVNKAMEYCVENNILKDTFEKHGARLFEILMEELRIERAMEASREEGMDEKAAETAIKMLKKGFDTADIAEFTNTPIEWVEGLSAKV